MYTVINEPKLVQDYNTEYYKLINFYSNVKRPSTFIKYYNLSMDVSPHDSITSETYDFYTKIKNQWDVYDITPTQIISAIQNTPEMVPDLKGQMIVSATTILLYTIDNPRIGDLVTFYKPVESKEVLRVTNVRLQLNSNYSTEPIKWYEVDLETAPIKYDNLEKLYKQNHYVYDLTVEKNIEYKFYQKYVEAMGHLNELLKYFKKYYSSNNDYYIINGKIFQETNELIYFIKKEFDNKYYRLFEEIYSPFGYWDRFLPFKYKSTEEMVFNTNKEFSYLPINHHHKHEIINVSSNGTDSDDEQLFLENTMKLLEYVKTIKEYISHVK